MSGHGVDVCACGNVIAQCRCFDHGNIRRIVTQACAKCRPVGVETHVAPLAPVVTEVELDEIEAWQVPGETTIPAEMALRLIRSVREARLERDGYKTAWHRDLAKGRDIADRLTKRLADATERADLLLARIDAIGTEVGHGAG